MPNIGEIYELNSPFLSVKVLSIDHTWVHIEPQPRTRKPSAQEVKNRATRGVTETDELLARVPVGIPTDFPRRIKKKLWAGKLA